ncbi:MAG: hypothetical protein F9K40_09260 [Kofleriaceae bacterium]|nr:MAG: hypothetical protein F9K40_09260 [Kofleriaceae bacterium]
MSDVTDLQLLDLVQPTDICAECGHTAEEHDDDLPGRCLSHCEVCPCDCEAFIPERTEDDDATAEDAA